MTDNRKLTKLTHINNENLNLHINKMKSELSESKNLIIIQRQQIQSLKAQNSEIEKKLQTFAVYDTSSPSLFSRLATAQLMQHVIISKSDRASQNSFLTELTIQDRLKTEFSAILQELEMRKVEIEQKKISQENLMREMLGQARFEMYKMVKEIEEKETERQFLLKNIVHEGHDELGQLRASLSTNLRGLMINKTAIKNSVRRLKMLEEQLQKDETAGVLAELLMNPKNLDLTWVNNEKLVSMREKQKILIYCLKLARMRNNTENVQLTILESKNKPIRSLIQTFLDDEEFLGDDGYDREKIVQQLSANMLYIEQVLKINGIDIESEFE